MPRPRHIGLFGGTFDPVHAGHLHLAALARETLTLDEVRFLPCRISPHKTGMPPASGEDRCEMLRLATADLSWAVVDDHELRQTDPSYSYRTAEAMADEFPGCRLFWIMGGDQWEALPRWQSPDRLAELVEFAVMTRGRDLLPRAGYRLHLVPGDHPASATAVRGAAISRKWLHPSVAEWIKLRGLYTPE